MSGAFPSDLRLFSHILTGKGLRSEHFIAEWNDLFARCPSATPFQHPVWVSSWIGAFQPQQPLIVEVRNSDRLVALAPMLIYAKGTERVLAFAGGAVSDYLGILCEPEIESRVIDALFKCFQSIPGWTILELTDNSARSPLILSGKLAQSAVEHDTCFVLELPATRDELLTSVSRRQRANLRNAASRLRRAGSAYLESATQENRDQFLHDLFQLHHTRWSQRCESGVLHDRQTQDFHCRVTPLLLKEGVLQLYRLRVHERTLAVIQTMSHRGVVYCYMQGFDPEFASLSPGTHLMFKVLEDAVSRGIRRFDFLRGEEPYKLHWRPRKESTYRICLSRDQLARKLLELDLGAVA